MLCNHLNNIYKQHIQPSLMDEEFEYSKYFMETFLDCWNSVDFVINDFKRIPDSTFYLKDNIILFQVYKSRSPHYAGNNILFFNKTLIKNLSINNIDNVFSYKMFDCLCTMMDNYIINLAYIDWDNFKQEQELIDKYLNNAL